jgi:hypothetical protein
LAASAVAGIMTAVGMLASIYRRDTVGFHAPVPSLKACIVTRVTDAADMLAVELDRWRTAGDGRGWSFATRIGSVLADRVAEALLLAIDFAKSG